MDTGERQPDYGSLGPLHRPSLLDGGTLRTQGCMHALLACPARAAFLWVFLLVTLPVWLYTAVTDVCCSCCCSTEGRRRHGRFVGRLTSVLWRLAFRVCFWIRINVSGLDELGCAGQRGRQVFVAANHVSWLDTPLICAFLPSSLVGDTKTLMARAHLRLPLLGRIARAVGHLPVPFTRSTTQGDFSVDRERMAEALRMVDDHVRSGGHMAVFPEGELNRHWQTLQQFRAGGMEVCIRHDMEVWGWVISGAADCWPQDLAVGGKPATLRGRVALLYPSARAAAEGLAGSGAELHAQAIALAGDMRSRMQGMLSALLPAPEDGA
mmetsp:Transcript_19994/g.63273  ORF Transcript_19994/g.63273 Transcript_19994/m.63273 type:complete len:323 (-) Transcript_19994:21-989(-)